MSKCGHGLVNAFPEKCPWCIIDRLTKERDEARVRSSTLAAGYANSLEEIGVLESAATKPCGTCGKAGKNNMVFNEKEKREHPCPTCLDVELLPKLCLKCLGTKVDKSRVLRDDINKHPPCPECDPGKEK